MTPDNPLVAIHFSFGAHGAESAKYLPGLKTFSESFYDNPNLATNHYIREGLGITPEQIDQIRRVKRSGGYFMDAVLAPGQKTPPLSVLRQRDWYLKNFGQPDPVNDPASKHFQYTELAMLDLLYSSKKIMFNNETHTKQQQKELAETVKRTEDLSQGMLRYAFTGQPERAIDTAERLYRMYGVLTSDRNQVFLSKAKDIAKQADKTQKPARIVVRVGIAHDKLVAQAANSSSPLSEATISTQYDFTSTHNTKDRLIQMLEDDPNTQLPREDILFSLLEIMTDLPLRKAGDSDLVRFTKIETIKHATNADEIESLFRSFKGVADPYPVLQSFIYRKLD